MNTKSLKFTSGPWRIQADPLLAKRHPLHENRYVTTDNEMETWRSSHAEGHGDDCAGFEGDGAIICTMPDSEHQKGNARLISLSPEMFEAIQCLYGVVNDVMPQIGNVALQDYERLNRGLTLAQKILSEMGHQHLIPTESSI